MVTGLLALLGTVVGGLIVVTGNYLIERYKSKYAEKSRYQQERLQLYTEFYTTASAIVTGAYASINEDIPTFSVNNDANLFPTLMQNLMPRIQLMAAPSVRDAARAFELEIYDAATEHYYPDDHAKALQWHLNEFVKAAREDLGVPVGEIRADQD
jgi:hypothetical protein